MKEGCYVALLPAGGGETVVYWDGTQLWAIGTDKPLDPDFLLFISAEPLDLMEVAGARFLCPSEWLGTGSASI